MDRPKSITHAMRHYQSNQTKLLRSSIPNPANDISSEAHQTPLTKYLQERGSKNNLAIFDNLLARGHEVRTNSRVATSIPSF